MKSNDKNSEIVKHTTCFKVLEENKTSCARKKCNLWIDAAQGYNCINILAKQGPYTLQEIGDFYGLTRMRICQIEKDIYTKLKESCS